VYGKPVINFLSGATDFFLLIMVSFIVVSAILVCLLNCLGEKEHNNLEERRH
jgi:hypothetical protein